jgi:DNA-directed RNA polymerase subunit RPC12/RpoP
VTFSSSRRRSFTEPFVLVEDRARTPESAAPLSLPSPPPPRPRTCPHCGQRDPVTLIADALDGTWSWACSSCASEVERVDAEPRRIAPSDDWEEDTDVAEIERRLRVLDARPGGGYVVPRRVRRRVVALARKDWSTIAISRKLDVGERTVRRIRAEEGIAGGGRGGANHCRRCGAKVPRVKRAAQLAACPSCGGQR